MSQDPSLYLICYDVADNRRRYRMDKLLKGYGLRVQRSVYECAIDAEKLMELQARAGKLLNHEEDRLHIYRLCGKDVRGMRVYGLALRTQQPNYYID